MARPGNIRAAVIGTARCVIAISIGLLLLIAAFNKVWPQGTPVASAGLLHFEGVLSRHGLVPTPLIGPVAVVALAAELAIGLWLLTHVRQRTALRVAAALLIVFSIYLALLLMRHGDRSCGCFGIDFLDMRASAAISRNLGLAAVASALSLPPLSKASLPKHVPVRRV